MRGRKFFPSLKTVIVTAAFIPPLFLGGMLGYRIAGPQSPQPPREHIVELRPEGFVPEELTIASGDRVVFRTTRSESFWPASDLHPTHTIYPEFDPRRPISATELWSFMFTRQGTWRYHDHLAPLFRGTIRVGKKKWTIRDEPLNDSCQYEDASAKTFCWEEKITKAMEAKGLAGGFEALLQFYQKDDPDFTVNCHDVVHLIGKEGYRLYLQKKERPPRQFVSYCGYGFYHGFMETMLQEGGSFSLAEEYCNEAEKGEAGAANAADCYHGIGHGFADFSNQSDWGDANRMVMPALQLCEALTKNERHSNSCIDGVYSSLTGAFEEPKFGLSIDREHPFAFCETQKPAYRSLCRPTLVIPLYNLADHDFVKTLSLMQASAGEPFLYRRFASFYVTITISDNGYRKALPACLQLPGDARQSCLWGIIDGIMDYTTPEEGRQKLVEFCTSPLFSETDQRDCFRQAVGRSQTDIGIDYKNKLCALLPKEYQALCR